MPKCWNCQNWDKSHIHLYHCVPRNIMLVRSDMDADEPCCFYKKSKI